ncbi:MAG: Asp-tRNA(Asn)/Glu-tRNA(Gln) amidotransferase subunit GatC [Lachnospiraceae bacterium]|nr:Asp-tRNA(Asn)/Glu-tRNA(Gln) amidotransferase subunit GatC [Lachnospiraceae bacterium]MDY2956662.1 Asp-tRNA(Asn)/Glu-tRNA(Gln) amidotransferase subunit GatC [Lachnospiraceae bacterium]
MSNKIDDETLEYVGILAKLNIEGEEKEKARADMEKMLDYVDKLAELDTSEAEPLVQAIDLENVFREDEVTNGDDRDNMLANAPQKKDGQYVVPRTF